MRAKVAHPGRPYRFVAWLTALVAMLVPTLGMTGIWALGSLAVPLWVYWRCRREEPPTAIPAAA